MRNKLWIAVALLASGALMAPGAGAFSKDSLVWKKCTGCHEPAGGKIPRVEEIRTTPEEWIVIIDRMHRLHGMDLSKEELDGLLKELCTSQILTPDELAKVSYLNLFDNPQTMETPSGPDEQKLFVTCVRCHSAGKIHSYRMTAANWGKVRDFHLYVVPTVVYQMREMHWVPEADAVLKYVAKAYPYGEAWKEPNANLEGSWLILGHEPGKGNYSGRARVEKVARDEYQMGGALHYEDGTSEGFWGRGTLYGGHALRTWTTHNGFPTQGAYEFTGGVIEGQFHFPAPDYRTSSCTWYPMHGAAKVHRVSPDYLLAGEETRLVIEGRELPEVGAADLTFSGAPVEVLWAERRSPERIEAQVAYRRVPDVAERAPDYGNTELKVKGLAAGMIKLAPRVDYLVVTPATGRARLDGGQYYPAEGVQFEAIAWANGPDVSDPSDDVMLGPVPATFHLVEDVTRPGDDDLEWLGAIEPNGKYLPSGDYAPIPARTYSAEGSGLVKVVADYTRNGHPFEAEAKLAVTVPDFIRRIR